MDVINALGLLIVLVITIVLYVIVAYFIWLYLPLALLPVAVWWPLSHNHDNLAAILGIGCLIAAWPWYFFAVENSPLSLWRRFVKASRR